MAENLTLDAQAAAALAPLYLFRAPAMRSGSDAVFSVAHKDIVDLVYSEGGFRGEDGLVRGFGGYALYRNDETQQSFLGVWGARNASRFRRQMRYAAQVMEIVRQAPPARLVVMSVAGSRTSKSYR